MIDLLRAASDFIHWGDPVDPKLDTAEIHGYVPADRRDGRGRHLEEATDLPAQFYDVSPGQRARFLIFHGDKDPMRKAAFSQTKLPRWKVLRRGAPDDRGRESGRLIHGKTSVARRGAVGGPPFGAPENLKTMLRLPGEFHLKAGVSRFGAGK